MDILKRNNEFAFPGRTGEIRQERQPLSTAVYKVVCDPTQFFRRKEKAKIQIQMLKLDKISGALWNITQIGIMLLQERNSLFRRTIFRYFLNYIDVQRQTHTSIDVRHEATIDGYWNTGGDKSLSEPWIGVTRFALLNKNPPEGQTWVQVRLTKKQVTTRLGHRWPEEWSSMP